jgi:excisionase family DNA binding protein
VAEPLPLAAASERLRGKPGRPRKVLPTRQNPDALALATVAPAARLLSVAACAKYLSVSEDSIRSMVASGALPRTLIPGAARRVLIDRQAIDRLCDTFTTAD